MYRKQQQASEKATDEQELKSEFFQRIYMLPSVNVVLGYGLVTYGRIKESNSLVASTLSAAEKTVGVAAGQTRPILVKFAGPIQKLDSLACQGLNILEKKAPIITKPSEEILKETTDLYNSTLRRGFDQYNEIKSYGNNKIQQMKDGMFQKTSQLFVTLYGNAVVNLLDKALEVAEQNVDYYLPPIEDEENVEGKDNDVAIERIGQLYSKIRERFYLNVTAKLQNAQMQSWETVSKLNFTITLMQYARENVDSVNQILHQTKDSLQKNASWLWEELNKLDPSVKPSTVVERVLYLARQLTRQLVTSYNSLAPISQLLPVTLQQNLDSAQKYSLYVYNQLHEAKDLNEMSSVMVTELKQNLLYLETCILNMLDYTFLHKLSSPEVDEEETEVVPTS